MASRSTKPPTDTLVPQPYPGIAPIPVIATACSRMSCFPARYFVPSRGKLNDTLPWLQCPSFCSSFLSGHAIRTPKEEKNSNTSVRSDTKLSTRAGYCSAVMPYLSLVKGNNTLKLFLE